MVTFGFELIPVKGKLVRGRDFTSCFRPTISGWFLCSEKIPSGKIALWCKLVMILHLCRQVQVQHNGWTSYTNVGTRGEKCLRKGHVYSSEYTAVKLTAVSTALLYTEQSTHYTTLAALDRGFANINDPRQRTWSYSKVETHPRHTEENGRPDVLEGPHQWALERIWLCKVDATP